MKHLSMKTLAGAVALCLTAGALATGTPAAAQSHYRDHQSNGWHNRGNDNRGHDNRNWDRGGYHNGYGNGGYRNDYSNGGWRERSSWYRGGYVSRYDYNRGAYVDYRYHHGLYRPPYGYEWRRVDNNYVLVAIASGLIATIIADGGYGY